MGLSLASQPHLVQPSALSPHTTSKASDGLEAYWA